LQGVDTQMLTNANAAIAKTIVDAKGDIIAATAADAVSRLAVGANDTVLTADSTTATGLKWAAAAASGASFSLLNAGGTAFPSGASTLTISGISGMERLLLLAQNVQVNNNPLQLRINADTGAKYSQMGSGVTASASYAVTILTQVPDFQDTKFTVSQGATGGQNSFSASIIGGTSTGFKEVSMLGSGNFNGVGNNNQARHTQGIYEAVAVITSVTVLSTTNFNGTGRLYVYGSAV